MTEPLRRLLREHATRASWSARAPTRSQRVAGAPDPARVPVDERRPEHAMVFAVGVRGVPAVLRPRRRRAGHVAGVLRVRRIGAARGGGRRGRRRLPDDAQGLLRSLEDPSCRRPAPAMIAALGAVFDCLGTLARRLDTCSSGLPADQPLRATLGNLIRSQLSPMLQRLIGYYLAGDDARRRRRARSAARRRADPREAARVVQRPGRPAPPVAEWPAGVGVADWAAYVDVHRPRPLHGRLRPAPQRSTRSTTSPPTTCSRRSARRSSRCTRGWSRRPKRPSRRRSSGTATSRTTRCSWRSCSCWSTPATRPTRSPHGTSSSTTATSCG